MLSDKTYSSFIDCFNRYDLISQGFVEKYPITKFISKCDKEDDSFINKTKACISNGKKVNVIYIGFGRISNAIHRASVMNDQLATIENNRLVPLPINYYAFDSNKENKEDKNSVFYYEKFLSDMKNLSDEEKKEYFELPNTPCNFTFTPHNINSFEFFTSLLDILKNDIDNTFNQIIISFGSDMDNLDYALKLLELFRQYKITRFHIYIRIKSSSLTGLSLLDNNDVDFFGGDDEFINHEVIVNDELHDIAKIINGQYDLTSGFGEDWYSKTAIKQLSSIYSGLNLRLKLNLLGYDYEFKNEKSNINDHNIYFKQLASKLTNKMDLEYEEYLFDGKEFNEANALAYQEKLRWNAFYIYHGYKPMKINDIHFDDNSNRIYKDDDLLKTHGCLTTVWGLDEYHRLIAKIISEKKNDSFEDALNDTQTYKYDYMLMNNFDKLFDVNSKYVLIKK